MVEDICRYGYDRADLAKSLKMIRHRVRTRFADACLGRRDSENDVLRPTQAVENKRSDIKDILIANIKRAQESARVLEETLKLGDTKEAEMFKQIRYELYTLEKTLLQPSIDKKAGANDGN